MILHYFIVEYNKILDCTIEGIFMEFCGSKDVARKYKFIKMEFESVQFKMKLTFPFF